MTSELDRAAEEYANRIAEEKAEYCAQCAFLAGAEFAEKRGWVKCSERLPDKNGQFLVVCSDKWRPHIICWNNEEPFSTLTNLGAPKGWWDNGMYLETEVTHWRPLPPAPEKEE